MKSQPRAYFVVIATTLLLLVTNQVLIQYWLYQKADDALLVNLAGRQRMLSQRIALLTVLEEGGPGKHKNKLETAISTWSETQAKFLDPESNLYLGKEKEIFEKVEHLNPFFTELASFQSDLLAGKNVTAAPVVAQMELFLLQMDDIVKDLEEVSEDRLWFISRAEIVLMLLTMLVFFIEIFLISRPFLRKILRQADRFESIAWYQSHMVRSPNAKIQGLVSIIEDHRNDLSEEEVQSYLAMIMDECKRLDDLTHKVVKMSQEGTRLENS